MQNKTKTYILLVLVLGIWGIIGYRIISSLRPDAPIENNQKDLAVFKPIKSSEVDTFSIQSVERDPFLGTLYIKKPQGKKQLVKKSEKLIWPLITYHGNINEQNGKNKVFVVSIKSQQHLMKVGQEVDGITLAAGSNNEITVSYNGSRKTIIK